MISAAHTTTPIDERIEHEAEELMLLFWSVAPNARKCR
jgi:hypothetical protein